MSKPVILLRIAYWIGIIADAYMVITLLLLPYSTSLPFRPEMETVASLMIGWTILLIWADQKPMERRTVLLLTIIMMIIGRVINVVATLLGKISFGEIIITEIPPVIVVSCFIFLYAFAERELKKV